MNAVIRYQSANNSYQILNVLKVYFCCIVILSVAKWPAIILLYAVTEFYCQNCYIPSVTNSSERIKQSYLFKLLKPENREEEGPKNIYLQSNFSVPKKM
jgi:hypothetical protein